MSRKEDKTVSKQAFRSETIGSEEEFSRRFPGKWKFRRDEGERIHSISGGLITLNDGETVLALADRLKGMFAQGTFALSEGPETSETDLIRAQDLVQDVDGLPVYQGSVSFLSRKQDGAVYLINNRLKDIRPFSREPRISLNEARRLIGERFTGWDITSPSAPVVFSDNVVSGLAWVFRVRTKDKPPKVKEVVLSADDGRTLHEEDRVILD